MVVLDSLPVVLADAGATVLLGGVSWTVLQSLDRPSSQSFLAVLLTLTVWALFVSAEGVAQVLSVGLLTNAFELGQLFPVVLIPGLWTIYVLSYTGRGRGLTRRRLAMVAGLVVPPVGAMLVSFTGPSQSVAEGVAAAVVGVELLFISGLVVYSTYRLVSHGWNHPRITRGQLVLVWIGVGAPYLSSVLNETESKALTVGFFVSGLCLAVAVYRYPVMTPFPEADYVTRTRVVEALEEIVVVLDWDGHILDVNSAATETFGQAASTMIGDSVSTLAEGLSQRDLSPGATGIVTLQTTHGRRQFRFSVSVVEETTTSEDDGATPVARTVLLRDITDEQTREQRLTVLNRVLRHNVRNKLDVIMAHAEAMDDDEHHQTIRETATELVNRTQKARHAENSMAAITDTPEPADVTAVARDVAQTYRREHPTSDISVTCPDELRVTTHRTLLARVLEELVDNALTHSDRSDPQVEISVHENDGSAVELVVADNGPGIPERERQILADGTETQDEHRVGIGLWFVHWAVLQSGGELEFSENEPTGSVVTVRLSEER
ncbi:ATP-binding protein [Halovenus salina]|uniref:histidine kinase n=1 Tax=Halovenus salina TaxID=1510225 RepID=A0ABD5W7F7_9EURY|nr:ATP-binding protein [Halovenus salina]